MRRGGLDECEACTGEEWTCEGRRGKVSQIDWEGPASNPQFRLARSVLTGS